MRVIHTRQAMEEGVDYIAPFPRIGKLKGHALSRLFTVRGRQIKSGECFSHGLSLLQALEMIVIDALNQRPPVAHDSIIADTMEEQKQKFGAGIWIAV